MKQARCHGERVTEEVVEKHDAPDSRHSQKAMMLGPVVKD
jgi:hypothetical protein